MNVDIFPGDIELGEKRFRDGSNYIGVRFTDLGGNDSATILLTREAAEHFLAQVIPMFKAFIDPEIPPN